LRFNLHRIFTYFAFLIFLPRFTARRYAKARFGRFVRRPASKRIGPILRPLGVHGSYNTGQQYSVLTLRLCAGLEMIIGVALRLGLKEG